MIALSSIEGAAVGPSLGAVVAAEIVEASPDAVVVVDSGGRVVMANRQAEVMLGWPRSELAGRRVEVLVPPAQQAAHAGLRASFVASPQTRPMGIGRLLHAHRRDGTQVPVEIALSPLRVHDEVLTIATIRDITARLEAEAGTRRIARTLDAITDAVVVFDGETLEVLHVNQAAAQAAGTAPPDLLGQTVLELGPPFELEQVGSRAASLLSGRVQSDVYEQQVVRDDERLVVEVVLQRPFDDEADEEGAQRWLVAVVRDVTDRSRIEASLMAAQSELAVASAQERIARDLHDTVIQQLFALGMGLQAVETRLDDPVVAERVTTTVDGLDATIRDIRTAIFGLQSRPDWGRGLRGTILRIAVDVARAMDFEPSVHFQGDVESVPPPVGDHLVPVVRETLSNAARHARARAIDVAIEVVADEVVVRVTDDGVGLERSPRSADRPGGGQGLANLEARATQLGGRMEVEPGPDGGTRITWRAPLG